MRYLLLGAGLQGTAIAFDLMHHATDTSQLTVVDSSDTALRKLGSRFEDSRLQTIRAEADDEDILAPLMAAADTVISAVPYWYNDGLAQLAIRQQAHFLDLGGNNDVVAKELELDAQARQHGVTIVPDCGLAPGMANILAYHLHGSFDTVDNLRIRVGGLPRHPAPPLQYQLLFSPQGLINEYIEPCVVVREGEISTVPGLSELETLCFPEPFGELEAFQTSGGVSTLPQTLAGKVRNLDYKTIRYKGHCEKIRVLKDLGLTGSEPIAFRNDEFAPREFLGLMLEKSLGFSDEDVALVLIEAEGSSHESQLRRRLRIIDYGEPENGISAMMRTTGYPAAIIAAMLASGEVKQPGAHPQEQVIPASRFMAALAQRGIEIEKSEESQAEPGPTYTSARRSGNA